VTIILYSNFSRKMKREQNKVRRTLACPTDRHRMIIECSWLEGTFRGHPAQPPCSGQGQLQLDQVGQSSIQSDTECFQVWGIDHLSGQPLPVFHHPHCKDFLPYIQSKSTLPQFKTISPCPVATAPAKTIVLVFLLRSPSGTSRPQ